MNRKNEKGFSESSIPKNEKAEINTKENQLKVLATQGLWKDIEQHYINTISENSKQKKQQIQSLFNKAAATAQSAQLQESALLHCKLIGLAPDHAEGLRNGAIVMRWIGAYKMAMSWMERYLKLKPNCPIGHNTLGTILNDIGESEKAFLCYQKSLSIKSDLGEAHSNIANIYHIKGNIDNAYIHSSHAISLLPNEKSAILDHLIYSRRACALDDIEKINWFTLAESMPSHLISNISLQMLVSCKNDDDCIKQKLILEKWARDLPRDSKGNEYLNKPYLKKLLGRKELRIGFISGDFRDHSVARFIWPLFKHLPRNKLQLFAYSTTAWSTDWNEQFISSGEKIEDVSKLDRSTLCNKIRKDELNILFDLTGFTKGSRTGALANRCAPIQATWLGYPGTTSVKEIDYIFTDSYQAPTSKELISEKLLISNGTSICFESLPEIKITEKLPTSYRNYITFGSLNNPYKFNNETLKCWANVMLQSNNSHLMLVRREYSSYLLRKNIRRRMEEYGIEPNRIIFFDNHLAKRNYLDCYNEIDISLDTYPVTGGTTTVDSLWMGVPVVSIEGNSIHQRISSAILRHAGYAELIATTYMEFKEIALDLCQDVNKRRHLRRTLREQVKNSKLCNSEEFSKDFLKAVEDAWTSTAKDLTK